MSLNRHSILRFAKAPQGARSPRTREFFEAQFSDRIFYHLLAHESLGSLFWRYEKSELPFGHVE